MNIVLEELKVRFAEAQKRLAEATQRFQLAQQALNSAQNDHNVWNAAVQIEMREEQAKAAAAKENQLPMQLPESKQEQPAVATETPSQSVVTSDAVNKTEFVRDVLAKHPTGMTPADLWREVRGQFAHRPYLYSVLKRLKDRDEVTVRRNKYVLKTRPQEEDKAQTTFVQ